MTEPLETLQASLTTWNTQVETRAEIVRKIEDDLATAKNYHAIAVHNVEGIKAAIERFNIGEK